MVGLGVLAGCTAGCVSLQSSGPVTPVTQAGVDYSQIQIWPSPPTVGESAGGVVDGFLQAARAGSAKGVIADDYLTGDALQDWKTDQNSVIVVADGSESSPQPTPTGGQLSDGTGETTTDAIGSGTGSEPDSGGDVGDEDNLTLTITADVLGVLDPHSEYTADAGTQQYTFGLTRTAQGYRISSLPAGFGVLLQQSEFESEYNERDVYFANAVMEGHLIPAQVYLPVTATDETVATELTGLVLSGVPTRLGASAQNGVSAAKLKRVDFEPDDTVQVTLAGQACSQPQADCDTLALQLAATFATSGMSTKVSTVRVVDDGDGAFGQASDQDFSSYYSYGIGQRGGKALWAYVITKDGQVERVGISAATQSATPTTIPIGPPKSAFGAVAVPVGAGSTDLALTSADGTHLYVVSQSPYTGALHAVFTGTRIGSLSWDQTGDLWFTAVVDGVTEVFRYSDDDYAPVQVTGLAGQVQAVAAAPDSDRVAVSYDVPGAGESIAIGTASSQADGTWTLDFTDSETVADAWTAVTDFGWYDEDALSVLGTIASGGQPRLYQLYADGSPVYDSLTSQSVQANPVADIKSVCWNADGQPIVSTEDGSLYELSETGDSELLLTKDAGYSPSY
jgi:hypothetical protein